MIDKVKQEQRDEKNRGMSDLQSLVSFSVTASAFDGNIELSKRGSTISRMVRFSS